MPTLVKEIQSHDFAAWDAYVKAHPDATLYHLAGWKNVIAKTYGHESFYLMAVKTSEQSLINHTNKKTQDSIKNADQASANQIVGILPLVRLKHVRHQLEAAEHHRMGVGCAGSSSTVSCARPTRTRILFIDVSSSDRARWMRAMRASKTTSSLRRER